jgi:hypothetical protein
LVKSPHLRACAAVMPVANDVRTNKPSTLPFLAGQSDVHLVSFVHRAVSFARFPSLPARRARAIHTPSRRACPEERTQERPLAPSLYPDIWRVADRTIHSVAPGEYLICSDNPTAAVDCIRPKRRNQPSTKWTALYGPFSRSIY